MINLLPEVEMENLSRDIYNPTLKVVGVGGGGCNAIHRMIDLGMSGVDFIALNTDHQALKTNPAYKKIQLGPISTKGLGAGGNPEVGRVAAEESYDEIKSTLKGADMIFLTAGMGGGTGTGAIPVVANIVQEIGAVSMAIVTTPFSFEMGKRQKNASIGLEKLRQFTNTLITIPNDRLLKVAPRHLPVETAFILADDVLRQSIQGITDLITKPGLINIDFSHIRRLIECGGGSLMAIGEGKGPNKAQKALDQALHHPLLDDVSLYQAAGIIANFSGGDTLTLAEINETVSNLHEQSGQDTEIILGVNTEKDKTESVQLILFITGLGATPLQTTISQSSVTDTMQQIPTTLEPVEAFLNQNATGSDYDLPAFLRRKSRYLDQSNISH